MRAMPMRKGSSRGKEPGIARIEIGAALAQTTPLIPFGCLRLRDVVRQEGTDVCIPIGSDTEKYLHRPLRCIDWRLLEQLDYTVSRSHQGLTAMQNDHSRGRQLLRLDPPLLVIATMLSSINISTRQGQLR